jgi:hypothetical protein
VGQWAAWELELIPLIFSLGWPCRTQQLYTHETNSGTSNSDAPPLTPPSIDTDPPPSPEPVEPVIVVIPHIQPNIDDDMTESLALGPTLFTGAPGQNAKI